MVDIRIRPRLSKRSITSEMSEHNNNVSSSRCKNAIRCQFVENM